MDTPLADNPQHVQQLCDLLQLGGSRAEPARLSGGFHHRVWRLETLRGPHVVKQLSPDTDLANTATRRHFNASERVAVALAELGIHAIHAIPHGDNYLHLIDGVGYLVYPWTEAKALGSDRVSRVHALVIARVLATIHRADIQAPIIADEEPDYVTADELTTLADQARDHGLDCADELGARLPRLESICSARAHAISTLSHRQVVSHGDLDQKNVLWNCNHEPVLIDWESARSINPTREVLEEALDWSGLRSSFDEDVFGSFMREYQVAGGVIEEKEITAAFDAVAGAWLDWLAYNIGRAVNLEEPEQRALGNRQAGIALSTITLLEALAPKLLAIMEDEDLKEQ